MSTLKPNCVVYDPAENYWCVLVETTMDDGEIRRFMSFHKNHLVAHEIKKAHERANACQRGVTVSMFEYEYIPNDEMLQLRLMMSAFEQMFENTDYAEAEKTNDCND